MNLRFAQKILLNVGGQFKIYFVNTHLLFLNYRICNQKHILKIYTYRITLEQTKQYERDLKTLLVKLANVVPEKVQELLELFSIDIHKKIENNKIDMLKCAYSVKEQGLLPSLFFPSDYSKTMDYYRKMVYDLEIKLRHDWPFYLEHQAFRSELYEKNDCT